eukprot:1632081-Pleurochrysis_carterae.AAC.1
MEGMIRIGGLGNALRDRSGCGSITRGRVRDGSNDLIGPQADFGVRRVQAKRASLSVSGESYVGPVLSEQSAECGVSVFLFVVRFSRGESSARVGFAWVVLGHRSVTAGFALRAIFMPVLALAPAARSPSLAPFFIRFWARTLRVSWFVSVRVASHGKSVRGVGICFQFAPDVACFSVAEHAACGTDRE